MNKCINQFINSFDEDKALMPEKLYNLTNLKKIKRK